MRFKTPKRGRKPTKRIDLTDMRELFKDRRVWAAIGTVIEPNGDPHWLVHPGATGEPFDVFVEVEIQPSQVHVTARLRGGMWEVPAVGDEVALLIPDGMIDFQPIVLCKLSSGVVPSVQGPAPGTLSIVNGQVLVHDGNGGAVSLALKTDVESVDAKYAAHLHLDGTGLPTSGPLATVVPNLPNPAFPSPDAVHPFLDELGAPTLKPNHEGAALEDATITGTSVLKGM